MAKEDVKVEKVVKIEESGKVAFIKEGVTIIRDISEAGKLKESGWVRK